MPQLSDCFDLSVLIFPLDEETRVSFTLSYEGQLYKIMDLPHVAPLLFPCQRHPFGKREACAHLSPPLILVYRHYKNTKSNLEWKRINQSITQAPN